mmetsp:Transcript_67724/g.175929  ORF Transcript_67724/g.175929 Transcript_67724/m.175929 type:complete len:751 (-) Transcript_67724:391-2643(-)
MVASALFLDGPARLGLAMAVLLATSRLASGHGHAELLRLDRAPLHTSGRYIVDNVGERVKWACVNWYGAYSTTHVVGGLEVQPMEVIVDRIVDLGFNCVRMTYSTQGKVYNPPIDDEYLAANPHLKGKRFLEIFDLTVKMLTDKGLMVIINNHNSKSGWCCHYTQDEGLWYVPGYNESTWIESLVFFAKRYRNNSMVVGFDLRNEVHDYKDTHLTWGDGDPATDWALAATKSGNAVLEVNPDALIIVMAMCFGMDLRRMKDAPIRLLYDNRVIYEAHNYLEYQVFDNISKVIAPWNVIRNWALLLIVACLIVLCLLRSVWINAGKPRPPAGALLISIGLWVAFFAAIAVVATWLSAQFGNNYCSVMVETDIMPWFTGSIIVCILACLLILLGVLRAYRSSKAHSMRSASIDDESEVTVLTVLPPPSEESPGVTRELSKEEAAAGASEPWVLADAPVSEQPHAPTGSQKIVRLHAPMEASPWLSPSSAESFAEAMDSASTAGTVSSGGQLGSLKLSDGGSASAEVNIGTAPTAVARRSWGCVSCCVSWRRILQMAAQGDRRALGLRSAEPDGTEDRVHTQPWDLGMYALLQSSILLILLVMIGLLLYIMGHIVPTYWWMERHLDGLWGFALEEGHPYTAPVWMGEFGTAVRGQYWMNFVRYLATRDVDFAYWAINGKKWTEGEIDSMDGSFTRYDHARWQGEAFGILDESYKVIQHTWKYLDLQGLMPSPATWRPDGYPCSHDFDPSCGAR